MLVEKLLRLPASISFGWHDYEFKFWINHTYEARMCYELNERDRNQLPEFNGMYYSDEDEDGIPGFVCLIEGINCDEALDDAMDQTINWLIAEGFGGLIQPPPMPRTKDLP